MTSQSLPFVAGVELQPLEQLAEQAQLRGQRVQAPSQRERQMQRTAQQLPAQAKLPFGWRYRAPRPALERCC